MNSRFHQARFATLVQVIILVWLWNLCNPALHAQPVTDVLSTWERHYGKYVVKVTEEARKGKDYTALTIWLGKKCLFDTKGVRAWVIDAKDVLECGPYSDEKYNPQLIDITGDGKPDLMVRSWTGGAHCCYRYYIFDLEGTFRKILDIDAEHGHMTMEEPKNGLPRVIITDSAYAYWNQSFAGSPMPSVAFVFDKTKNKMVIDMAAMKRLNAVDLKEARAEVLKTLAQEPPQFDTKAPLYSHFSVSPKLIDTMLKLKYSGRGSEIVGFVNEVWPENAAAQKSRFLSEFNAQQSRSGMYKAYKWD